MKAELKIEGMSCMHCVKHVKEALTAVEGVTGADVALETKTAVIDYEGEITESLLAEVIDEAGYELVGFKKL